MANFGKLLLTNVGINEQYKAQAGNPLKFKRIGLGSGSFSGNVMSLTKLVNENVSAKITNGYIQNGAFTIEGLYVNDGLDSGFAWREIGVFVEDENGKEVLYCYANAGNSYDYIPATADDRYAKNIRVAIAIGNATNVSIVEDEGIIYVNTVAFNAAISELKRADMCGYFECEGNDYNGMASNSGIEFGVVYGNSVQDGTPTPEAPIEIQSWGENTNVNSGSCQLFDHTKLADHSSGGVTLTNNGDGSFTISGSGEATEAFSTSKWIRHEEAIKLLKPGRINLVSMKTRPYLSVSLRDAVTGENLFGLTHITTSAIITQEMLDNPKAELLYQFHCSAGDEIIPGTFKPVLYQYGNGEWEEFIHETVPIDGIVLRGLPSGVRDVYEDGKITRHVGEVVFDGSSDEFWQVEHVEGITQFYILDIGGANRANVDGTILCNRFKSTIYNNKKYNYESIWVGIGGDLAINSQMATTVTEWKAWLAENPITVLYELETPFVEYLELPSIPSWFDRTNVWHDSVPTEIVWRILKAGIKARTIETTLLADSWVDGVYTLTVAGVTATSTQDIVPSINITSEQFDALQAANIIDAGQSRNTILLKAFGDTPTIDIPIRVIL